VAATKVEGSLNGALNEDPVALVEGKVSFNAALLEVCLVEEKAGPGAISAALDEVPVADAVGDSLFHSAWVEAEVARVDVMKLDAAAGPAGRLFSVGVGGTQLNGTNSIGSSLCGVALKDGMYSATALDGVRELSGDT
jgi:hypothetical protein